MDTFRCVFAFHPLLCLGFSPLHFLSSFFQLLNFAYFPLLFVFALEADIFTTANGEFGSDNIFNE